MIITFGNAGDSIEDLFRELLHMLGNNEPNLEARLKKTLSSENSKAELQMFFLSSTSTLWQF